MKTRKVEAFTYDSCGKPIKTDILNGSMFFQMFKDHVENCSDEEFNNLMPQRKNEKELFKK